MNTDITQELKEQTRTGNGCIAWFIALFLLGMMGSLTILIMNEYRKNKRHPNIITNIDKQNKIISVFDIETRERRTINYADFNPKKDKSSDLPKFRDQLKYSAPGDTVRFVAPEYKNNRTFVLGKKAKNSGVLYLNRDSILSRMQNEQMSQKQR